MSDDVRPQDVPEGAVTPENLVQPEEVSEDVNENEAERDRQRIEELKESKKDKNK